MMHLALYRINDLEISDDSDKESDDITEADKAEFFKRKIDERSPEQDFQMSKKDWKKLKKNLNKSK